MYDTFFSSSSSFTITLWHLNHGAIFREREIGREKCGSYLINIIDEKTLSSGESQDFVVVVVVADSCVTLIENFTLSNFYRLPV